MKSILILFTSFLFIGGVRAQQDSDFTDKAEAKNLLVNGLREGKWIEYINHDMTKVATSPIGYRLVIYKAGKPYGIYREYYISGKLKGEAIYVKGVKEGVEKSFDENGTLVHEANYTNGEENGMEKNYNEIGKLLYTCNYVNGSKNGFEKWYYENGNLRWETFSIEGKEGKTIYYGRYGKEVK
jgi:hypothetical protein